MLIVEYPFTYFTESSDWRPLLPIEALRPNSNDRIRDWAIIDTGAKHIYLPEDYADEMKIPLTKQNERTVISAGQKRKVHQYKMHINVFCITGSPRSNQVSVPPNVVMQLHNANVFFLDKLKYPILGVIDFLEKYVLTINYQRKQFSILTPSKDKACKVCWPESVGVEAQS